MNVKFSHSVYGTSVIYGQFKKVEIVGSYVIADGKKIAFFNRDESYWANMITCKKLGHPEETDYIQNIEFLP